VGEKLSSQKSFFNRFVFNEVDVLEKVFEVICSGKAGSHIDPILKASLQQISYSFLFHVPTDENIHVYPKNYVDNH
jgi:hypothetical protein